MIQTHVNYREGTQTENLSEKRWIDMFTSQGQVLCNVSRVRRHPWRAAGGWHVKLHRCSREWHQSQTLCLSRAPSRRAFAFSISLLRDLRISTSDVWAVHKIMLGICVAVNTLGLTYSLHRVYTLYALVNDVIE